MKWHQTKQGLRLIEYLKNAVFLKKVNAQRGVKVINYAGLIKFHLSTYTMRDCVIGEGLLTKLRLQI